MMIDNTLNALRSSLGGRGGILVTDTSTINGEFVAVKAITDCVFNTLTTPEITVNDTEILATGSDWGTLSAGDTILARITTCKLTSGKAYLVR